MELDLDNHISEEVLDEIFINDNLVLEELIKNDEDVIIDNTGNDKATTNFKVPKIDFVETNEYLIKEIRLGNNEKLNREKLVKKNTGIVYNEAKKCTCRIPFEDKVQYGFVGLLQAINKYNIKYQTTFAAYAGECIKQQMYRSGNNEVRMIRIPEYLSNANIEVQRFINYYINYYGKTPLPETIAESTGIKISRIKRLLITSVNTYSLDTPTNADEDMTLSEIVTSEGADYSLNESTISLDDEEVLTLVIEKLTYQEKYLIELLHGLNGRLEYSLEEVIRIGYFDDRGKLITSKATLSRRYSDIMKKIEKLIMKQN